MHYAVCAVLLTTAGLAWGNSLRAPPPKVIASVGQVWPQPQMRETQNSYMVVRPKSFSFVATGHTCDILTKAFDRYTNIIFPPQQRKRWKSVKPWSKEGGFKGYLTQLSVNIMTPCETMPHLNMNEMYQIKIDNPDAPGVASLGAQSVWGALRGLETFSQLLVPNEGAFNINSTQIMDFPRFSHRGLMVDTSRHFLPLDKILQTLDLMAMNKLNVLHWHVVDDQSFPYVSTAFPNLSKEGAYSPLHVYTEANISTVVEYARVRGIRVLAEFDTPGHTQSWGLGQPGLLTPCYKDSNPDGTYGPVDPSNEANYPFLQQLFTEITTRFPDHYVHLGGDEVSFDCWKSNSNITAFMAKQNITGDYSKLEEYYITKLLDIVSKLPTKNGYLVWQEVFDNGVKIAPDTVVHVWKDGANWQNEMEKVTAAGYDSILSSCWYLNYISYGTDWYKYYECDPQQFNGTDAQKQLVKGGEACMWGEFVDRTNLISRTWPRASVVAEKLWSAANHTTSTDAASPRLEEHRCRLLGRGYDVEPLWPSFCAADVM